MLRLCSRFLVFLPTLYCATAIRLQLATTHTIVNKTSTPDEDLGTFQAETVIHCGGICRTMGSAAMDFAGGSCQCIHRIAWMATELLVSTPFHYRPYRTGLTNTAFKKPTQSSPQYWIEKSDYANDENICNLAADLCCYSTDLLYEGRHFWLVDMEAEYHVHSVEMVMRGETFQAVMNDLEVWIGMDDSPTGDMVGYKQFGVFPGPHAEPMTVIMYNEDGILGRYVGVFTDLIIPGWMSLCDVQVLSTPP